MKKTITFLLCFAALSLSVREARAIEQYKIALIGLRQPVFGRHLAHVLKDPGVPVKLVGIAETVPELVAEARRRGATDIPIYADYTRMLDEVKPDIVFGFLENNRHLCQSRGLPARVRAKDGGLPDLGGRDPGAAPQGTASRAPPRSGHALRALWRRVCCPAYSRNREAYSKSPRGNPDWRTMLARVPTLTSGCNGTGTEIVVPAFFLCISA